MAALEFPAFGSICFQDASIDPASKTQFKDGFCVGPHCDPVLRNCSPGESDLCGDIDHAHKPRRDLLDYCGGLLASAHSRIPLGSSQDPKPSYWGSIADHRGLLNANGRILPELAKSPLIRDVSTPTLLHADLHMRNIFVPETRPYDITAIIDWQNTNVEPTFIHANETPDFASRQIEDEDQDQDEDGSSDSHHTKDDNAKKKQDILLRNDAFDVCMKGFAPIIGEARSASASTDGLLFRPFRHCNTSWRDSAPAVRQELIELSTRWGSLGFPGECPYVLTMEELRRHQGQYADFEIAQNLKLGLMRSLHTDSDGWVASSDWGIVKPAHDVMFREWLQAAEDDEEMDEAKAREVWPFDQI